MSPQNVLEQFAFYNGSQVRIVSYNIDLRRNLGSKRVPVICTLTTKQAS